MADQSYCSRSCPCTVLISKDSSLQQGTVDPGRDGEVGATDTERVGGARVAAQLRPRHEISEAILRM